MTTSLTLTPLRFDLIAKDHIKLDNYKAGHYLRGALGRQMLETTCPENPRREKPSPEHAAVCPVCWLLAAETEPGEVRRAYSITPPDPLCDVLKPGERFSFGITLYGDNLRFLPYFVLAVSAVGRKGVGVGRGRFELETISAVNTFTKEQEVILNQGEKIVRVPELSLDWDDVGRACQALQSVLGNSKPLQVRFLSPTRLTYRGHLAKSPDFGIFFRRLLKRIDALGQQFAQESRRPSKEIQYLHNLADKVRLVDSNIRWVDYFYRKGKRKIYLSGFVGQVVYQADDWSDLLPWLVFGQAVQVGKHVVRGNGVYKMLEGRG